MNILGKNNHAVNQHSKTSILDSINILVQKPEGRARVLRALGGWVGVHMHAYTIMKIRGILHTKITKNILYHIK